MSSAECNNSKGYNKDINQTSSDENYYNMSEIKKIQWDGINNELDITEEIISEPEHIAIKTIKKMNQREIED